MGRARVNRLAAMFTVAALAACACGDRGAPLRVGAKPFDEQRILAHMTIRLLRDAGKQVDRPVVCRDTYTCHRSLRDGSVDVMVEYTGTGLLFLSGAVPREDVVFERIREQYAPLGIEWLFPLGFSNSYQIAIRTDHAVALGIETIADLVKIEGGIRLATPPEYPRRPLDGLHPLLRRHGLRLSSEPVILADPVERLDQLHAGRVDVAVLYSTDGMALDPRLTILEDRLGFFPPYEAAVLTRAETLRAHPDLPDLLRPLQEELDVATIRRLNYSAQVEGRNPADIAVDHLLTSGLLASPPQRRIRAPDLVLTSARQDRLQPYTALALTASRKTYPERTLRLEPADDPVGLLVRGRARLAVLGAERFFEGGGDAPEREERLVAVGVLGNRVVHVLTRSGAGPALGGRVGVPPRGSGGARIADAMLAAQALRAELYAEVDELIDALQSGRLDAAIVVCPQGDAAVARALDVGGLVLRPLQGWLTPRHTVRLPYLRPVRLPSDVYAGQDEPVDTLGAQVVLAAPSPSLRRLGNIGNPGSALSATGAPLPAEEVRMLSRATGVTESVDPVLPSPWVVTQAEPRAAAAGGTWLYVLINLLLFAFIAWLAWLIFRREPKANDMASGKTKP